MNLIQNKEELGIFIANFIRLAQLLEAEDKMYEQEFMANLETPEQVREKMAQRLFELKNKRE